MTMTAFRGRLRLCVAIWLVLQVASLSAFVPLDCCAAHRPPVSEAAPSCHDNPDATHCPMHGPDGQPCPMHGGHGAGHQAPPTSEPSNHDCALRGTCNGPMAALLTLLWQSGVLTDAVVAPPDFLGARVAAAPLEHLISFLAAPDSPPPRA
jgi:hypothetical protein